MESRQEKMRQLLFAGAMPEMPQNFREFFNLAFLFRRKYLNLAGRTAREVFKSASDDMQVICNAYDGDEFLSDLLLDVYMDIERKIAELGLPDE